MAQVNSIMSNGSNIPIFVIQQEPAIDHELAKNFIPFQNWTQNINPNLLISKIVLQHVDYFGKRIGFLKFQVYATLNGNPVPGIVFMRGHSVCILPIITDITTNQKWIALKREFLMPAGDYMTELPAGMLDGSGDFVGVAAKEFKEEMGVPINMSVLISLSEQLKYASIGACDEGLKYMALDLKMSPDQIKELNGRIAGNKAEGEETKVVLVKLEDIDSLTNDMKVLCALRMAQRMKLI